MRIKEVCSCGAEIEVDSTNNSSVHNAIRNWREDHKHYIQHKYPYYSGGVYTVPTNGAATTKIDMGGLMNG